MIPTKIIGHEKYPSEEPKPYIKEFNKFDIKLFKFYRTPDGEECAEKTYYYTKYATISSLY